MEELKSILHELYVYSEWKPEPEYIQKTDGFLPENISALWRWLKFLGPKKSLIDSVTAHNERQQKWHIALGDEGKVIAVLTDNILEIRTKRSDYATIAARTTVSRDAYPQWRKLVWSPDCSFVVLAYGNGVVSFFDLTASNLFNIPIDCSRPEGLECTDNTHAVADIIFMPLTVKDNKWNWEVLIVNYDGKVRRYLVSQMDGFTLHHTNTFSGGVSCVAYCDSHSTLYVAGVPRSHKDPNLAHSAGLTAWRILNDEPHYKLSVVSDQLEGQTNDKFHFYIPYFFAKNVAFIVQMVLSPDSSKLVCLHCNGDVSIWRLPLLKLMQRFPLAHQPEHDLRNPLTDDDKPGKKDLALFYPANVNWWSNDEIILSRFSGAVSVCNVSDLVNLLGKKPEFFQGTPRVTRAFDNAFMALECETNVVPVKRSSGDDGPEAGSVEESEEPWSAALEAARALLYWVSDLERFQPRARARAVRCRHSRYRLLATRSTTPRDLFNRKIESGHYSEALALAETFHLDSDLVYQQQWRKNPVSTDAIDNYLSKVSKKIWAVHQCVDRLPETLPAAKELLQFGLKLTNEKILEEINKERSDDDQIEDCDAIVPEHLNAYTSELLRCRHVMLFYKERLRLYESILKYEKSTYVKDEYHRLRSNSILHSSMEIAKEGRIEALTCLWPHINTTAMKLAVLDKLPETINPLDYQHLLPTKTPMQWFESKSPIKIPRTQTEEDWCRKPIFRSIWSSNWSEETTPDTETAYEIAGSDDISKWYDKRAREIEEYSGLASHSLTLATLATVGGGVDGLDNIMFHLLTLDTLIYDINVEGVSLKQLEKMSVLETCSVLMKTSTPSTFVSDLKTYVIPYLQRYEELTKRKDACVAGLLDYLESISVQDLSPVLLLLQSPDEYKLDLPTHLELVERCLYAHTDTDQLDIACDLLNTILKESGGCVRESEVVSRVSWLQRAVAGSARLAARGERAPPAALRDLRDDAHHAHALLTRLARDLSRGEMKPSQSDWDKLLKDILELQATVFDCITKEQCYEIYASALLTSGELASTRLAGGALCCSQQARGGASAVPFPRSLRLVLRAATEYFNSASSLTDPALELAKCCLTLIKDNNPEIQEELDLIAALKILHSFNLNVIPIQVRLCENRVTLIEECLKSDPNAFLASHKLLKLAALLRIAGDDEIARECVVLELVCAYGVDGGGAGGGAAVGAARRLAALRAPRAAPLLARVAAAGPAPADTATRRHLYAAALATCDPAHLQHMLQARLSLELESLQQMGITQKESCLLSERCPSTDDEFADAITTPVIEKKDLVAPAHMEKKIPLFNYLLDTFQNKFSSNESKASGVDVSERKVCVQEFYRSLYPEYEVSECYYRYDRFSVPDGLDADSVGHAVLDWFYIQNCLETTSNGDMENEVVQKCAEDLLYKDTGLSVACLLRAARDDDMTQRFLVNKQTDTAIGAALLAALMQQHRHDLKDEVYLTKPRVLAERGVGAGAGAGAAACLARLAGLAEAGAVRARGLSFNDVFFHGDPDYRAQVIYRLARCPQPEDLELALSLARKYDVPPLQVWLQHAAAPARPLPPHAAPALPPQRGPAAHHSILSTLLPVVKGDDHAALIQLFQILKDVDEKPLIHGLTAADHIKLLKKAKASSPDLDYKLLIEQPTAEVLTDHVLGIMKPENVGMVAKFLRTLPPAVKLPLAVNTLYTKWLTKYFFSVPPAHESSKKWMQQYRQCASYFNKLSKEELLRFVNDTCFTDTAIERVPAGTRNVMIMQAIDYCQQEQENEFKINKNEQTWAQVGQELERWARFLENFHSSTVQSIIDSSHIPRDQIWPDIEKSHGSAEALLASLSSLAFVSELRLASLQSLLQCLHAPFEPLDLVSYLAEHALLEPLDAQNLVNRVTQYHKEGLKIPEDVLELLLEKAGELGLPPHQQIALLSLGPRSRLDQCDDLRKVAQFSLDLFRNEWPDEPYAMELTEEKLLSEEGRREAFHKFLDMSDTLHRRRAMVDVLACWPPVREGNSRSLHCEFLHKLLTETIDAKETLVYIKMLLRSPMLTEEETKWLTANVTDGGIINAVWVLLLNKCETAKADIVTLLQEHRETIKLQEIDDSLVKELLDHDMLVELVPTAVYPSVVDFVLRQGEGGYDVPTASAVLVQADHRAEAGHLCLMSAGVPPALRTFSDSVIFASEQL